VPHCEYFRDWSENKPQILLGRRDYSFETLFYGMKKTSRTGSAAIAIPLADGASQ